MSYLQAVVGHVDVRMHIGHWVLEVGAVYGGFPELCTALYHWLALLAGNPAHPHSKLSVIYTLLQCLVLNPCNHTARFVQPLVQARTEAALQLPQYFAFPPEIILTHHPHQMSPLDD